MNAIAPGWIETDISRRGREEVAFSDTVMLLDPIYAYARAMPEIPAQKGLILNCEHSVTENTPESRKSYPIPHWSVPQIRRIGADAVKVLVWYRADAARRTSRICSMC